MLFIVLAKTRHMDCSVYMCMEVKGTGLCGKAPMALESLSEVAAVVPAAFAVHDFTFGRQDLQGAAVQGHGLFRDLQASVNEAIGALSLGEIEDSCRTQIERIMLFSQELSGLKLVDGGERQSWEEVDSWGKHVLGKKGVEACLNILHEKIVGRSSVIVEYKAAIIAKNKECNEGLRDPGQSPLWFVQAFINILAGVQALGFLMYCTALNITCTTQHMDILVAERKRLYEEQSCVMNDAMKSCEATYCHPFPINRSEHRFISTEYLGETWKISDGICFDLNKVSSDLPICGVRLYKKGEKVGITIQTLASGKPETVAKMTNVSRKWIENKDLASSGNDSMCKDVEYVLSGWNRVPDPLRQCICGLSFCRVNDSVGIKIHVIDKLDLEWEGAAFWQIPKEANGQKMKLSVHNLTLPRPSNNRQLRLDNNVLFMSPVAPAKNGFLTGIKLSILYNKNPWKSQKPDTVLEPVIGLELETSFQ